MPKIVVTEPGQYECLSLDQPEPGLCYNLEDATEGTGAQNRAFHALVSCYWQSGAHSYQAKSFNDFRNQIKRSLGAGFEAFVYAEIVGGKPIIRDAATYAEIPEPVRRDPDLKQLVRGRLKSWADYSKRERIATIDRLVAEMIEAGVNTKKFHEILEGMSGGSKSA